jgi:hypothetical protein
LPAPTVSTLTERTGSSAGAGREQPASKAVEAAATASSKAKRGVWGPEKWEENMGDLM